MNGVGGEGAPPLPYAGGILSADAYGQLLWVGGGVWATEVECMWEASEDSHGIEQQLSLCVWIDKYVRNGIGGGRGDKARYLCGEWGGGGGRMMLAGMYEFCMIRADTSHGDGRRQPTWLASASALVRSRTPDGGGDEYSIQGGNEEMDEL